MEGHSLDTAPPCCTNTPSLPFGARASTERCAALFSGGYRVTNQHQPQTAVIPARPSLRLVDHCRLAAVIMCSSLDLHKRLNQSQSRKLKRLLPNRNDLVLNDVSFLHPYCGQYSVRTCNPSQCRPVIGYQASWLRLSRPPPTIDFNVTTTCKAARGRQTTVSTPNRRAAT